MPDRKLMLSGVFELRVGLWDCCTDYHHRRPLVGGEHRLNALSGLLFKNRDALILEMLNRGVVAGV